MFDCRMRSWYLQAATCRKNIIILIDTSGSMKGLRMQIARSTVYQILDTLTDDDYFNIIKVNEPRCEKTGLWGFRPGATKIGLYCHRRWLEA